MKFIKSLNFEEFKSLYKGISSGLFGNVLTNAIYFFAYKLWQDIFVIYFPKIEKGSVTFSMLTSFLAAVTNVILTNPVWVLHTRMAKSNDKVILI